MNDRWEISTTECGGDRETIMRRGNVYQIANGYMGCRGTLDEDGPEQAVGITLAGIFDRVGEAWREPVNAPNGAFTRVTLDGVELTALGNKVAQHRQTLHFTDARLERETRFKVRGAHLVLRSTRFLSAATPNLGVVEFSVTCDRAADVTIRTGIDANIWDLNGPHLCGLKANKHGDTLLVAARTHELGKPVAVAEACAHAFGERERRETKARRHLRVIRLRAEPGRTCTFHKFFAVVTGNDPVDCAVPEAAIAIVERARVQGYDACLEAHRAEWRRKWQRADVVIAGDAEAQHALRYSILQLLMVAPVRGSANSIPARALSGQVYKGAIFWDTEMFMFPFFLHTTPDTAAELLRYRIRTLDGARRKARTEGAGYRGAFYAWESQDTGDEACTYFNVGDPFTGRALRTYFRDTQVHISGDVAMAMWAYFQVTGDDRLLLEGGAEVILECARFYDSYAFYKPEKQRYEILDVVGPDEYHERVNNNAFTSAVARETFQIAEAVVAHLRQRHPTALRALVRKLDIARELRRFRVVAERLFVPAPDPQTGVIEQFDGYFQLREATVEELKAQMVHPHEYLGAGQGLAVPTKIIKQADVVMMLHLFKHRFSERIKRANWEYYEPRTEHGSSLSACAYAMVATEFGNLDFAYRYFLKTAKIDLEAKYKVYVGTVFMSGSHPAASGGAWMTAIFGFGGVRANAGRLEINPRLYPRWRRLEFNLTYRGDVFRLKITPAAVTVAPAPENRRSHRVVIAGRAITCRPGVPVTVAVGRPRAATATRARNAAPATGASKAVAAR